ncbi:MAG: sugar phosphate isomerase/epimerase [Oscillospiraceae bacterium]|nr:sugar phosphate isomerase/epimerase [Oscillospiraceae bacterium]
MFYLGVNCERAEDHDLAKTLHRAKSCGYDAAEIDLDILPFILDGELCRPVVDYAQDVMSRIHLRYSAHVSSALDLRSTEHFDAQKNLLFRSIDVCALLGIQLLNVHYEACSKIRWVEQRFCDSYREAAQYAQERGVILSIENIEIEDYRLVLDFVSEVGHENFRFTLDTGHLFLACAYFGEDFETAVDRCMPYVGHMHLNDNTGRFMPMRITDFARYKRVPMSYRNLFGMGDLHLPPYFGKLPFDMIFEKLTQKKGTQDIFLICEYNREDFQPFEQEICRKVRQKMTNTGGK